MLKPVSLFLGLRYTRAKKNNHFVSFISLTSMLGIALGVMVLITVLSVMNGFDEVIRTRFFAMAPEITITNQQEALKDWVHDRQRLLQWPGVKAAAPFVGAQGLITYAGRAKPLMITGILPAEEAGVTALQQKLLVGSLAGLNHFGIILGAGLAEALNVGLGDKVTLMVPEATVTPAGMLPRFKRFTVSGVFSAGTGFNFDSNLAFVGLHDAQLLMQLGDAVTGIKLRIQDIYQAPALSEKLSMQLGENYQVSNWTEQFGAFFQAVKMEKTMMFLILLLIIAVAAFNLVSSLVMVVNDKQAEIAILRTLGALPRTILGIFMIQGMMVGFWGTLMGLLAGVLLASHVTGIVDWLQHVFNMEWLSSNIYFVDYLPSKILVSDLLKICGIALLMSFLATLYPAMRASKMVITEALRYD